MLDAAPLATDHDGDVNVDGEVDVVDVLWGSRVMQGWSDGVIGMRPGGKRLLMLPPELGYGSRGVEGVIPPDARLIFTIDLVAIEKTPGG